MIRKSQKRARKCNLTRRKRGIRQLKSTKNHLIHLIRFRLALFNLYQFRPELLPRKS